MQIYRVGDRRLLDGIPRPRGGINGGVGATSPDVCEGYGTFSIEVPDLGATLSKIEPWGSRVGGPEEVPEGPSIAVFADPEGHLVGLTKSAA